MNLALAERIADAVLYEGYLLYPYRPSSVKNRQRWTFGGLCPRAYAEAQSQGAADAWTILTEVLVQGAAETRLDVRVRYLHLVAREIYERAPGSTAEWRAVPYLRVDGQVHQSWQEAADCAHAWTGLALGALAAQPREFAIEQPAATATEPLRNAAGEQVGAMVRTRQALRGAVNLSAERLDEALYKVSVCISNLAAFEMKAATARDEALMVSLVSTHALLGLHGGAFVSLLDPPDDLRAIIAACRNEGIWPVLVGEAGERDLLLASPIILYDYPEIAPESAGDLFDGTEIDEILTLRILTMTEAEKDEMRQTDERGRALLDRTESLSPQALGRLHGTLRSPQREGRP